MKFRDVSERVKGGKLDPLSKMGKSKLTGQEIAKYYKDNPKAKQAARDKTVKKAIELALDLGGAQSYAIKEIEKLKRGLSKMPVVQQALRTANESVNEGVSVSDERIVNKGKGIIIMIDDNGKKVSAIFKDKKNADKFNRNKPSDVKKLLKLAKSKKYPKAIDENEMTSTSSVAMPEIPLGRKHKVMKRKELEKESINEETLLYRIKDIQKPELDKFKSSARLMKLKINIKQSPMKKDTLIRLQGSKKQIRDFDAVVRGKSSYGDPSLAMKEEFDLNEESATMKKVRQVVKKKGMMNIDGMKLDLTTASMIASVYDKVNPTNKKRMDSLKLPQLINLTMKVAGKARKESTELQEGQTYKSIIQGLEKDKKEVAGKSKAFRQNDTKYIDKAINFLKMLEKEGIPAGQIGQVDFVTNRVPKFFIGPANKSPSLSKFTPNDVKKAVKIPTPAA